MKFVDGKDRDPIKILYKFQRGMTNREAKICHVTDFIGQFQQRVKFYAVILFIGSSPVEASVSNTWNFVSKN